jgi:hypothetical protein
MVTHRSLTDDSEVNHQCVGFVALRVECVEAPRVHGRPKVAQRRQIARPHMVSPLGHTLRFWAGRDLPPRTRDSFVVVDGRCVGWWLRLTAERARPRTRLAERGTRKSLPLRRAMSVIGGNSK